MSLVSVRTPRVLVIDRNDVWRRWATDILRVDGYNVQSSRSVEEATELLEQEELELVLLGADIAKREIDAVSSYARRASNPIRFLVVSPVRLSYFLSRLFWKSGVVEIQLKPHSRGELLTIVAEELQEMSHSQDPRNRLDMQHCAQPTHC
jgi:DNA-binding NtrC family response regulator